MSLLKQAAAAAQVRETFVSLTRIQRDTSFQARAAMDDETIQDYREAIKAKGRWPFPPVDITHAEDDTYLDAYYLTDGFHRTEAAAQEGLTDIPALVTEGTRRDAILSAIAANPTHGLRRTNADKRRAVTILLLDEEWRQWSDGVIAEKAHVSQPFVSGIRQGLATTHNGYESAKTRITATGRKMDTSQIGNNRQAPAPPVSKQAPAQADEQASAQADEQPFAEPAHIHQEMRHWLDAYMPDPVSPRTHLSILRLANTSPNSDPAIALGLWLDKANIRPDQRPSALAFEIEIQEKVANQATQHATRRNTQHIFRNSLTAIAGMFRDADEDLWYDTQGTTRLSELRGLVATMQKDLEDK